MRRAIAATDDGARAGPLLVAVSGGADSTALLLALHALATSRGPAAALVACHVDHGLRPPVEREAEQRLLADLCVRLDVALDIRTVDVADLRTTQGRSWEDAARRARYAALADSARAAGAVAVCSAHTLDDQAETVLLRAARGTGPRGLRGMLPVSRPWGAGGPALLRPLLGVRCVDTAAYCRACGERWSEDSSNTSDAYARNQVRRYVLPALRAAQPGADVALARLAGQAAGLSAWLDGERARLLDALAVSEGDDVLLKRAGPPLHPFLGAEVVAALLTRLLDAPGSLPERTVRQLVDLWQGASGRQTQLPRGWRAIARPDGLLLTRATPQPAGAGRDCVWPLLPGMTYIPGWRFRLDASGKSCLPEHGGEVACIAPAVVAEGLTVEFRRPGMRMRPAGMVGSRKLQDLFVDAKVPREQRGAIPLVCAGGHVIWAVGVRRSADAPRDPQVEGAAVLEAWRC